MILQIEIDYKAECHSGDAIESLGSRIVEDTNGTGIRRQAIIVTHSACVKPNYSLTYHLHLDQLLASC